VDGGEASSPVAIEILRRLRPLPYFIHHDLHKKQGKYYISAKEKVKMDNCMLCKYLKYFLLLTS